MALTETALATAGVPEPARVAEALGPCATWLATMPEAAVIDGLRAAADPVAALHGLERLAEHGPRSVERLEALLRVLGGSPALATTLVAQGAAWAEVWNAAVATSQRSVAEHIAVLEGLGAAGPVARAQLQAVLRGYRRRELLRIGGRDLAGLAPVDETVRELSALAEATIDVATACARARVAVEWGGDPAVPFVVFGMGKLGGGELNYSSDVDLVYVYAEEGEHAGGRALREFFAKVGEEITKAVGELTGDGLCFRVDLRLRPGGDQGPLAASVGAALAYYEAWGQTWERAVWLKAHPVGGDRALGAAMLEEMRPFVYRRYLDFSTLEDLQAMKRRVDQSLTRPGQYERDVKLGRGGIREIEFWVQAHQLVHGGKDERLHVRGTLETLRRLESSGYTDARLAAGLADAYRFLRDVEHKIQVARERQTQRIPDDPDEYRALVRRTGFLGPHADAAFEQRHGDVVERVHAAYEALFHGAEEARRRDDDPEVQSLLVELDDPPAARARLGRLGFADPEAALRDLVLLRDGPPHARASPRRQRVMAAIAPSLVGELVRAGDPGRALHHLATFMGTIGARTSFLHLLQENPGVLRLLVRLFGTSEFLSRYFVRHPELLDSLVRADLVRVVRTRADLADELGARLEAARDLEAQFDTLRRFRHEEFLRIGIHDIEGELAGDAVREQLTLVADTCLAAATAIAERAVRDRLGLPSPPEPAGLAIVGMGKLGGGELNYHSDLDIVFLYEAGPEAWWQTHAQGLAPHEYMSRVAQRTISALQTPTQEGIAYRIDTRLRPSGNQGALVSSLAAFESYHRTSAALWERQALAKARVVTGPAALRERIEVAIDRVVYGRGLRGDEVAEMAAMRRRIAEERGAEDTGEINIKTDWGGLVDVEFAVQMLQLRHGHTQPAVRRRSTLDGLRALIEAEVLSHADGQVLTEGYAFLRTVEGRMRIERDQPVEAIDDDPASMQALARRLGYAGSDAAMVEAFRVELDRHRQAIRAVFERLFAQP